MKTVQIYMQRNGGKLSMHNGLLEVSYFQGQKRRVEHLALHLIESVWLEEGCSMSSNVLLALVELHVPVFLLGRFALPAACLHPCAPHPHAEVVRGQVLAAGGALGLQWVRQWAMDKNAHQQRLLEDLARRRKVQQRDDIDKTLQQLQGLHAKIRNLKAERTAEVADTLRGWEGAGGAAYFRCLSRLLPERYHFAARSQHPARDAFNAFLNYGYGILYGCTEAALLRQGLHPNIGFLHRSAPHAKSLVYDFIEPFRGWIDAIVFSFFSGKNVIMEKHVRTENSGAVSLVNEGKQWLINSFNEFYKEQQLAYDKDQLLTPEKILDEQARKLAKSVAEEALPPKTR